MNTKFTIKNFRVFNSNGATFELAPITILTGCNSSGKSSLAKALLLLDSFLSQIRDDVKYDKPVELSKYKIDFSKLSMLYLGNFDKTINRNSKEKTITFEYTIHSLLLSEEVTVCLQFAAQQNDELNNGYLKNFTLKNSKSEIIYSSDRNEQKFFCNLNLIKQQCLDFVFAEYWTDKFNSLNATYESGHKLSKEQYEKDKEDIISHLKPISKNIRDDVFKYIRLESDKRESLLEEHPEIIEWTKKNNSFFYMPIFDLFGNLNKENIKKEILENIEGKDIHIKKTMIDWHYRGGEDFNIDTIFWINRVLDDFEASNDSSLLEYFKHKEEDFFMSRHRNSGFGTGLCIPNKQALRIQQYYVYDSPKNIELIDMEQLTLGKGIKAIKRSTKEKEEEISKWKSHPIDFDIAYTILMEISEISDKKSNNYFYSDEKYGYEYCHNMYNVLIKYVEKLVLSSLLPDFIGGTSYVSSSRVDVKRLYTLDIQNDFSTLLKEYFDAKLLPRNYLEEYLCTNRKKYKPDSFMNKWIKKFEIGDSISLKAIVNNLGVQIFIHKQPNGEGTLLADEGYGITQLVSLLLQIEKNILEAKGVKFTRPCAMSALDGFDDEKFYYEKRTIIVEEPEIHLHPKFQSLLADMFLEAYKDYNIHFIVETHSEYLIRRSQVLVAKMGFATNKDSDENSPFRTYYIPKGEKPYSLGYRKDGKFAEKFGTGFYDESANLTFEIL